MCLQDLKPKTIGYGVGSLLGPGQGQEICLISAMAWPTMGPFFFRWGKEAYGGRWPLIYSTDVKKTDGLPALSHGRSLHDQLTMQTHFYFLRYVLDVTKLCHSLFSHCGGSRKKYYSLHFVQLHLKWLIESPLRASYAMQVHMRPLNFRYFITCGWHSAVIQYEIWN
jgi:hypothetical protein